MINSKIQKDYEHTKFQIDGSTSLNSNLLQENNNLKYYCFLIVTYLSKQQGSRSHLVGKVSDSRLVDQGSKIFPTKS